MHQNHTISGTAGPVAFRWGNLDCYSSGLKSENCISWNNLKARPRRKPVKWKWKRSKCQTIYYISTLVHSLRALTHTKEQDLVKREQNIFFSGPPPRGNKGTEFRYALFCEQTGHRMAQKTTERKQEVPNCLGSLRFSYLDSSFQFTFVHKLRKCSHIMCALLPQLACKHLTGMYEGNGTYERRSE